MLVVTSACGDEGVTDVSLPARSTTSTASGAASSSSGPGTSGPAEGGGSETTAATTATGASDGGEPAAPSPSTTLMETPTEPRPGVVAGALFRDDNHNGERDFGEPGLPGILVSAGPRLAVTDANGSWSISGLGYVDKLRVHTAWFRTQCDARACAAGPGSANDFAVADQQLVIDDIDPTTDGYVLDAGLVPDWEGEVEPYPMPPPEAFVGNEVDAGLRMTRMQAPGRPGECERGITPKERLCAVGDHPTALLSVLNQGLEPLSDVKIAIDAPPGMEVALVGPNPDLPNPAQGRPSISAATNDDTGTAVIEVPGPVLPGGVAYVLVQLVVLPNAIASPLPLATANPFDRTVLARIVDLEPEGEADSQLCLGWSPCLTGAGSGDKLLDHDEDDFVGWNVAGLEPRPEQFDAVSIVVEPTGDAGGDGRGVIITVSNAGTRALRNIVVDVRVPPELTLDLTTQPEWATSEVPGALLTVWPGVLRAGASISVPLAVAGPGTLTASIASIASTKPDPRTDSFPGVPFPEATHSVELAPA